MSLELAEPPALEPVTLAGMKARLRITHTDQDDRIQAVISASRRRVEAECGLEVFGDGLEFLLRRNAEFFAIKVVRDAVDEILEHGTVVCSVEFRPKRLSERPRLVFRG